MTCRFVTRITDNGSGHGCYPPRPAITGSPNVFVNNLAVVRVTDKYDTHCCKSSCHDGFLEEGSTTVFVNNLAIGRQGDPINCGSFVDEHSPDTCAGD